MANLVHELRNMDSTKKKKQLFKQKHTLNIDYKHSHECIIIPIFLSFHSWKEMEKMNIKYSISIAEFKTRNTKYSIQNGGVSICLTYNISEVHKLGENGVTY